MDTKILAMRIKMVRLARNQQDVGLLAEELGIHTQTWMNYEAGVTMPATVLLELIHLGANVNFLLTGKGMILQPKED